MYYAPMVNKPKPVHLPALIAFDCVARQVYRFTLGRPESDYDRCTLAAASQALGQAPFDVRALVAALVASDSFVARTVDR